MFEAFQNVIRRLSFCCEQQSSTVELDGHAGLTS
jgi:hypothetical protein